MRIKNLPSILSMNGSQDALVIEQTDGSEDKSRKVSPAQIKQYVLGNSIDDIYSVMGQNGAKNLIPYPYYEKTHVDSGITWTDNGDGTVTANGTATAASYFLLTSRTLGTNMADSLIEGERYTLTGCPTGGSNQNYDVFINETYNSAEVGLAFDYGNGATFTLNHKTETNYGIGLRIRSGQTVSNLTFKPMLRITSDTDNTYQPYAKTNKQLTDELDTKANLNSAISSSYVSINPASYGDPSHMYTAQHNMFLLIVFPYNGSAICRIRVTATDSFFYMQGENNTIIPLFIPKGMKFFFDSTTTVTDVRVYTDYNN